MTNDPETKTPAQVRLDNKRQIILEGKGSLHKILIAANVCADKQMQAINYLFIGMYNPIDALGSELFQTCYVQSPPKHETGQAGRSFWNTISDSAFPVFEKWHRYDPQPTGPLDLELALNVLSKESRIHNYDPQFLVPTAVFVVEDGSCPTTEREKEQIRKLFVREANKGTTPFIIHQFSGVHNAKNIMFLGQCAKDSMGAYVLCAEDRGDSMYEIGQVIATHALGLPSLLHKLDTRVDMAEAKEVAKQIVQHHGSLTL